MGGTNDEQNVKQVWAKTTTVWGKLAVIFFYAFVYVNIVEAVWALIEPSSSKGTKCLLGTFGEWERHWFETALRGMCLFLLGFLLYAESGGIQVRNVAHVALFVLGYAITKQVAVNNISDDLIDKKTALNECLSKNMMLYTWISLGWIVFALIFAALERKLGHVGTEEEQAALVV